MTICPTQAIVAPYKVDARRCISYLTIELRDDIPEELRPLIGNRIYGCDDCQLICPWNRYAQLSAEADFQARPQLMNQPLLDLLAWDEATFLKNTEGSPIRRIGHACWQRNLLVGLGNAEFDVDILAGLTAFQSEDAMVMRHAIWAIAQQKRKAEEAEQKNRKTLRLIKSVEKGLTRDA
jgi:epoxyqueuosine reductase